MYEVVQCVTVIYNNDNLQFGMENGVSLFGESKHPKVHISLGLAQAVSHLKTNRQEEENVGEEWGNRRGRGILT